MFINTKQGEVFWGGRVVDGIHMPYKPGFSADLSDPQGNQVLYALMSSHGKVVYSDGPFKFTVQDTGITVDGTAPVLTKEAGGTLRDAVKWTQTNVYGKKGAVPPADMFVKPQFNTWIELIYDQNQKDIIRYAESIAEYGYPHCVLMIDDNWQEDYGVWRFHEGRFPDPKAMMDRLHELGFKVMLWVVPFVSPDCATFRALAEKGVFVKTKEGRPYIAEWWNGYSALIDLSNPEAKDWFKSELRKLQDEYGVDGFKFDAGAPFYYREDCVYYDQSMSGMKQTQLFCTLASEFEYNELRETVDQPELACVERLCDKAHSWDNNGLNTLTPNSVAQSLMGYNAICPDMIGGGSFAVFVDGNPNMDRELVVRMAQNSALLPMMQFSLAPWRVLSSEMNGYCRDAAILHEQNGEYLYDAVKRARETGEAVLRPLEYNYPHCGYEYVTDEFMVEDRLLVCPVIKKGAVTRQVVLPDGKWRSDDGDIYEEGTYTLDAPLSRLIRFEKIG